MDIGSLGSSFISVHDNPSDFKDFPNGSNGHCFLCYSIEFKHSCTYHCRNEFEVHAHFVGTTIYVDNYRIVFQTLPFVPYAGENSTLNFSILDENNSNIGNLYAALTIKSKAPENISRIPYRFYEFSDITFPKFLKNGKYEAKLEAKILGNPKYEVKSLISSLILQLEYLQYFLPID